MCAPSPTLQIQDPSHLDGLAGLGTNNITLLYLLETTGFFSSQLRTHCVNIHPVSACSYYSAYTLLLACHNP